MIISSVDYALFPAEYERDPEDYSWDMMWLN